MNAHEYASPACAGAIPFEDDSAEFRTDDDNTELLRSFDMIFQLHQRSEEIRRRLEHIDRILLTSRTIAGLVENVTRSLQRDMDLVAVRLLFREDHALSWPLRWTRPCNMGTDPPVAFGKRESLSRRSLHIGLSFRGSRGKSLWRRRTDGGFRGGGEFVLRHRGIRTSLLGKR